MNKKLTKELRKLCFESPTNTDIVFKDLSDLKVGIIDHSKNPYKSIFEMSTQTWSSPGKWSKASPQLRFEVVKKVLEKKALPLALEAPVFTFQIEDISRAAADQIMRTRYGVVYAARGFKDNNLNYLNVIIPHRTITALNNSEIKSVTDEFDRIKEFYSVTQKVMKVPNWACRFILPMYAAYNFIMVVNFLALQKFCANRMQTTEMEDTVGTAWLMREQIKKVFPLLAEYLRPACDWQHKDTTTQVNGFADEMGIIHNSDNRHPGFDKKKYDVRYEEPCTDINYLQKALKINIPKPTQWIDYTWKNLKPSDKKLFNE